jgi:hypothetical protein
MAQPAFGSSMANPSEKAAKPSIRPEVRVLPDLLRSFEDISSSLEQPNPDVPLKQKRAYRRKEHDAFHRSTDTRDFENSTRDPSGLPRSADGAGECGYGGA